MNLASPTGQELSATYTYAGMSYANPHAPTQIANGLSTTTLVYDNDGNVVQKTTDGKTTTYIWDYANRLTALGVGGATTTYGYDAFGSRVLQTGTTTTYIYPSKFYSIASSTVSGAKYATTTEYVFNGDSLVSTIDQQIAYGAATGTPQTLYIHPDHLGSTNVVTNASGTVVQTLDFYPYGATRISSSVGGANSARKFINRFADQSNLDYLNARYYDPARGQFISEDSTFWSTKQNLSNPQSLNSYSYANGNPITNSDPNGDAATLSSILQSLAGVLRSLLAYLGTSTGGSASTATAATNASQGLVLGANIAMPMRAMTWDSSSNQKIAQLDPRVRQPATNFINDTQDWLGVKLRVNEGYRYSSDQDAVYAKGRDAQGNIIDKSRVVSYAKGGQSFHQYGLAMDVVITNNGQSNPSAPITPEIAAYGKQQGFEWGGDFPSAPVDKRDPPHFQMTFGQTWQELYQSSTQ